MNPSFKILFLAATVILVSCQKEIADNTPDPAIKTSGITTTSSIPGVNMLKDGYPMPNIQTSGNLGSDDIGWHIDFQQVSSGYTSHVPKAPTSNLGSASLYCSGIVSVDLLAGQNIQMGTLSFANDAENLYVTYSTNPDWYMSEVHLYVGSLALAPKSGGGTPSPGRFPIKSTFSVSTLSQDVTYTIPISSINVSNFIIAAHASVLRVDVDGDVIAKETAWASGTRFTSNKNWATYTAGVVSGCDGGQAGDLTHGNDGNTE